MDPYECSTGYQILGENLLEKLIIGIRGVPEACDGINTHNTINLEGVINFGALGD